MSNCYLSVRYSDYYLIETRSSMYLMTLVSNLLDDKINVLDVSRDKVIPMKTTGLQKTKGASSFTIDVKVCYYYFFNENTTQFLKFIINL